MVSYYACLDDTPQVGYYEFHRVHCIDMFLYTQQYSDNKIYFFTDLIAPSFRRL